MYFKALDYINSLPRCSFKRYGITGILELLELMGNPQNELKYIHIAGTNGKGSISTFCARSLEEAGFKVGLYTSPYIVKFRERIQINGEYIKEQELADLVFKLKVKVQFLNKRGIFLTGFDFITALSLQYFYENSCDFVVLEVGMGGRLDSTNVIPAAQIAIISHIDYDHILELGGADGSILNIAREKAGILKYGGRCVCYEDQRYEVFEFLKSECIRKNVEFIVSYKPHNVKCTDKFTYFEYGSVGFKLKLLGLHQVRNAMVCVTALLNLGVNINYIKRGLELAFIPARFEVVSKNPVFVLDGAHNEDGINSLIDTLKLYSLVPKIGILSIINTKNFEGMMFKLKNIFDVIILTKMADKRALPVQTLKETAYKFSIKFIEQDNVHLAINQAKEIATNSGIVVAFGSLYFAAQVRKIVLNT